MTVFLMLGLVTGIHIQRRVNDVRLKVGVEPIDGVGGEHRGHNSHSARERINIRDLISLPGIERSVRFRLSICRAIHRVLDLLVAVEYNDVGQMVGIVVDLRPVELDQVGPEDRARNPIAQQIRTCGQETLNRDIPTPEAAARIARAETRADTRAPRKEAAPDSRSAPESGWQYETAVAGKLDHSARESVALGSVAIGAQRHHLVVMQQADLNAAGAVHITHLVRQL